MPKVKKASPVRLTRPKTNGFANDIMDFLRIYRTQFLLHNHYTPFYAQCKRFLWGFSTKAQAEQPKSVKTVFHGFWLRTAHLNDSH
jgi:hypothetical protein